MKRITQLVLSLLVAAPFCCAAATQASAHSEAPQASTTSAPTVSAEAARADLESLYRTLQSAHYSLFAYRPKSQYDARFLQSAARLLKPMSRLDLIREFQPFVAFGQIGHANIGFPVPEYIAAAQAGGTVLPFDIRVDYGKVFVAHSYLADSRIKPGVELLSFDGKPIQDVLGSMSRFVSGERSYMVHAQLERFFPRWLWLERGDIRTLRVKGLTRDGTRFEESVDGLPIGQVEPQKSEWTEALAAREVRIIDARTAYLRPGAFYNIEGGDSMDPASFRAFIDDAFGRIKAAKARNLIIDLRDNPGGDNSFSDLMVAWFASRPFRFSDNFSIKASPEIRHQFEQQVVASGDQSGIIAQMSRAIKTAQDGATVRIELPKVSPGPDRFKGRVFVLVNRHSYSNAASVAGMVQDYGFAKVIGEETADLPSSYASSAQFTLPHSGIVVTYPKGYFVRPNGNRAVRGVIPDLPIDKGIFSAGHDAVLAAAVKRISRQ